MADLPQLTAGATAKLVAGITDGPKILQVLGAPARQGLRRGPEPAVPPPPLAAHPLPLAGPPACCIRPCRRLDALQPPTATRAQASSA